MSTPRGPSDGAMIFAMALRWLAPARQIRRAANSCHSVLSACSRAVEDVSDAIELVTHREEETARMVADIRQERTS